MKHYTLDELAQLEAYANSLWKLLNNADYRHVSKGRRYDIRIELNRVVKHLYSYNINLTDLLA